MGVVSDSIKEEGEQECTHHVDGVGVAGQAVRVVLEDVGSTEDALNGALFDVELEVAEAFTAVN